MTPSAEITPSVFASLVHARVGRRLIEQGFEPGRAADYREAFERGTVQVIASYGGFREGLSVAVRRDDGERPMELAEALSVTECLRSDMLTIQQLMAVNADVLDRLLARCARLLLTYGAALLEGDRGVWDRADALRAARTDEYNRRVAVSSVVIERADDAWLTRDYARVRDLLAPVRENLDETHRRRLEFAESRVA